MNKFEALTSLTFNLRGQETLVSDLLSLHTQAVTNNGETSSQRWQSRCPDDTLLLCPAKEQPHPWWDPRLRKQLGEW